LPITHPRLRAASGDHLALAGLAFSLFFAGPEQVEKYLGTAGAGLYLIAGVAILVASRAYLIPAFVSRVSTRVAWWLALGTIAVLAVLFFRIYPLVNAGIIGGGSDSDDALNLATRALLHGEYPYRIRTYLGSPATYLPGSLLLAVPFVLLGNAAYQDLFWLAVFLLAMTIYLEDIRQAVLLLWATLLCSRVLQSLVTGGELLASSIYAVLFVLLAMRALGAERPRSVRWLAASLLGLGLSSRVNYLLLLPVIVSAGIQKVGWKETAGFTAVIVGTMLAVILPFWLYDPQTFWVACLTEQNFAARLLIDVLPHADLALPLASALVAVAVACRRVGATWEVDLLANCALTQAFPVVAMVVLASVESRRLDLHFSGYGVHFLFFGAVASWNRFVARRPVYGTITV
jgi:hypothetical protein